MKKEPIYIVVASNNYFSVLLSALLKSIELNTSRIRDIHIFILNDNISRKNKLKIQQTITIQEIKLHWVDRDIPLPVHLEFPLDHSGLPSTTYLRLLSPYIVPENAKKVIYLDVDMIVLDDLNNLFDIDMQGHPIAAVSDITKVVSCEKAGIPNYKELGLNADDKYFNAGLLLIDVERWKANNYSEIVLDNIKRYKEHVVYDDQYGLNVTFARNWFELSELWNWYPLEYSEAAKIIHFIAIKPIYKNYRFSEEFKEIFYKYLVLTPFKGYTPRSEITRMGDRLKIKLHKYLEKINRISIYKFKQAQ